jgi:hypothetical protein
VHCWNNTDKGKMRYSEKNLPQHHFVHHKSHTDCPGIIFNEGNLTCGKIGIFFNRKLSDKTRIKAH